MTNDMEQYDGGNGQQPQRLQHQGHQEQQYPPRPTPVRMMPSGPMGSGSTLDPMDVVNFTALAGARGLEKGTVVKLWNRMQANAMAASLGSVTEVLDVIREANDARINTIMQQINQLERYPIAQPTGWRAFVPQPYNGQQLAYVSLAAVMSILMQALVENPPT